MSDNVDKLLDGLLKKSEDIEKNIEVIIEEKDTDKKDEEIAKRDLDKLIKTTERINETQKKLNDKEISSNEARKRIRKYQRRINELAKKSGQKPIDFTKISVAKPRPPNQNPNDVRCYIRYNNQGNPYRICDDGGKPDKPPAQITPPIPVEEFLNKLGRTYGELTEGQRREYHRIDMANRRFEEREANAPAKDALDEVLREQRRLGGFVSQQKRIDEAIERKQLKIKEQEIAEKYKEIVKKSNLRKKDIKGTLKEDFLKQAGLTDKVRKEFKEKGIKPRVEKVRAKKGASKKDITELEQANKDLEGQIKNLKKEIVDGKEKVVKVLEGAVQKKGKFIQSFDI